MQFDVSAAGFLVGIVVGLTGMGGGALMTPILVIGFGVQPLAAVSSDLVAAIVMKPIGGGIHWRRGTVHAGLVRWLAAGSIPSAFLGAFVISHIDGDIDTLLETILGAVLLVAAISMAARWWLGDHRRDASDSEATEIPVRRLATLAVGIVGGLVVGMTSVGSGSLMIVALMVLYPRLSTRRLVGTDLVQAIPLVGAAALGHLIWGDMSASLTGSLLLGSIPGVILGAHISSRGKDFVIRPVLIAVLVLSGAKLLGASDEVLAALLGLALTFGAISLYRHFRRSKRAARTSVEQQRTLEPADA